MTYKASKMSYSKPIITLSKTNNVAQEYIDNINFVRRDDFFSVWPEWKSVVQRYYSKETRLYLDFISDYSREILDNHHEIPLHLKLSLQELRISTRFWNKFHPSQFSTILQEIKYCNRLYHPGNFRNPGNDEELCSCFERHNVASYEVFNAHLNDRLPNTDIISSNNPYPYDCRAATLHYFNLYIPLMLSLARRSRKSHRRYYRKLIKFLLVVDSDRVIWEDVEKLIFNPPTCIPRNIPKYVYSNHYFEKFTGRWLRNLPFYFERQKHNIVQQGGMDQSFNASVFHELCTLVSDNYDICQQVNLNLSLKDQDQFFTRFESTLLNTQEAFFASMKDTLLSSTSYMVTMFVIVATIALLGYSLARVGFKIIKMTLNLIYKLICGTLFSEEDTVIQQGEDGKGFSIPALPAMIVKNVINPPGEVLSGLWNNPQVDKVMRRIGYIGDPKIHRGLSEIADWAKRIVTETIHWFMRDIMGIAVAEDIESKCSPVENWYNDCDHFLSKYWSQEMEWNDINWSVLMNLYGRGMALTRQRVFDRFKNDIWKILFRLGNILEKFNTHGRAGTSVRNPPVTIYLQGDTGVGKSSLTYPLAAAVLKGIYQKEKSTIDLKTYWKNLIYMRSAEQEFWDGYENQLVTVFDDFSQMVDSSGNPNTELFEVIRASNSFPYPLHMASLDQKATTSFSSKIILVSSNLDQPKAVSLNFPEALYRRFDLSIHVSRIPGVKVTPGKFDPHIYRFQRYNMSTQTPMEDMTYNEVVFFCVTEYFKRKGFVDSMDEYITKSFDETEPIAQQGLGTAAGNTVCSIKTAFKQGISMAKQNFSDFIQAMSGVREEMHFLEMAMINLRGKLNIIAEHWFAFKLQHPYIVKALKFIGIMALVIGIIKLFYSFTAPEKKTKIMSLAQFAKGEKKVSETCDGDEVKRFVKEVNRINSEGYGGPVTQPIRVEAKMEDTVRPLQESYVQVQQTPIRVESYVPPNQTPIRVEVFDPAVMPEGIFKVVCPHEYQSDSNNIVRNLGICKVFIKSCDATCPQLVKQQGVTDVNASEVVSSVVQHNLYKLYTSDSNIPMGHGMFLRGRIFMCPKHYLSVFKSIAAAGGKIFFRNSFLTRAFEITAQEIVDSVRSLDSPDEDSGEVVMSRDIMAFPVRVAMFHSNTVPYFASKPTLSQLYASEVVMPIICESPSKARTLPYVGMLFTEGRSNLMTRESATIKDDTGKAMRVIRHLWEYRMDTRTTYCGAPLIVRNVQIGPGKIIGMHVAGMVKSGVGFSTPVYQEDVKTILNMFPAFDSVEFRPETKLQDYPTEQMQVPPEAEFVRMGSVEKAVAQPCKSKIIPSLVYRKIREPVTRPCALYPVEVNGEMFDPRLYRLNRLGNISEFIDGDLTKFCVRAVVDAMSTEIQRVEIGPNVKPVYTFEEAVSGIDGEVYINAVKRSTSPGYPFVHLPGFSNRKEIFGDDEKCDMSKPSCQIMEKRVDRIISLAKQGIAIDHIFMDTLKDERKPLHKFHKTRLFSAGPVDYLIACKRYFNGIVAVLQKSRNFCHVSVGTDHNTYDWTNIVNELHKKSTHVVAGDFEGFDASQAMRLLEAAGEILIRLSQRHCGSTEEDAFVMRVLLLALYNSVHITNKEVYRWTHSLPSGHYLTAIINSIFVCLTFDFTYCLAMIEETKVKPSYTLARSFFENCGIVAYGDDHIVSLPRWVLKFFNQQTIPRYMAKIGLGYTMEDKDRAVDVTHRLITEVTYLKRSFVWSEGRQRWLAPISLDTVLESPMWMHKCPDWKAQTVVSLETQLKELCLHRRDIWCEWAPKFHQLLQNLGHYTMFVDQEETLEIILT